MLCNVQNVVGTRAADAADAAAAPAAAAWPHWHLIPFAATVAPPCVLFLLLPPSFVVGTSDSHVSHCACLPACLPGLFRLFDWIRCRTSESRLQRHPFCGAGDGDIGLCGPCVGHIFTGVLFPALRACSCARHGDASCRRRSGTEMCSTTASFVGPVS